jgi:hypothetical protein
MRRSLLALGFLLGLIGVASAQTVPCSAATVVNCVPVVHYQVSGSTWGYPPGATPVLGLGTGTTGAVTGTLAGVAAKTTYICGFDVSALGGTATVGPITVTGLLGGTLTYQLASTVSGNLLSRTFMPCLPASAVNTAIVVTTTADGTASGVDVDATGFQL